MQKATITGSQPSAGRFQEFASSQCFFPSAEPDRSVAVMLIQRDPGATASRRSIAEYWHDAFERFRQTPPKQRKQEIEEEQEKKGRGSAGGAGNRQDEKEGEDKLRAIGVPGVGDEAFWSGPAQVGGVLYVRKGEKILRVSVGGPGSDSEKLEKSKVIAAKALSRL